METRERGDQGAQQLRDEVGEPRGQEGGNTTMEPITGAKKKSEFRPKCRENKELRGKTTVVPTKKPLVTREWSNPEKKTPGCTQDHHDQDTKEH